ncbi:MAG: hypothetical protein JSV34_03930 [Candidatus Omnitrophota bacterium]|nr:MAG: hypothetical protein JSV34_03930 [Candidatus Omnitrophota bacterium]
MIRTVAVLTIIFYCAGFGCGLVRAQMSLEEAEKKAEQIHNLASSDVIYLDEEEKALYYQNIQIIQLLKEIRDLLRQQAESTEIKEEEE